MSTAEMAVEDRGSATLQHVDQHHFNWARQDVERLEKEIVYLNEQLSQRLNLVIEKNNEIAALKAELRKISDKQKEHVEILAEEVRQRHMGNKHKRLVLLDCESQDMPERFDVDDRKLVMRCAVYEWLN